MSEKEKLLEEISNAVQGFDEAAIFDAVNRSLEMGVHPSEIIEKGIAKALRIVGEKFEQGEFFLPDLVGAAEPAQRAVKELLEPELKKRTGETRSRGKILLGTSIDRVHY